MTGKFLLAAISMAAATCAAHATPIAFNGHYYEYNATPRDWLSAAADANATTYLGQSGYLATIGSAAENDFLLSLLDSIVVGTGWIGATDAAVEGQWRWVVGSNDALAGQLFWQGGPDGTCQPGFFAYGKVESQTTQVTKIMDIWTGATPQ